MKDKEQLAIEYCKNYHHNRDNTKFFIAGWDAAMTQVAQKNLDEWVIPPTTAEEISKMPGMPIM